MTELGIPEITKTDQQNAPSLSSEQSTSTPTLEAASRFAQEHREVFNDAKESIAGDLRQFMDGEFTPDQFLQILAYKIGLEKVASVHAKLGKMEAVANAYHDKNTGLPTATLFRENVDNLIEEAKDDPTSGSFRLTFADMDNFGIYNSTYLQEKGDNAIKRFAEQLRTNTRANDTVARLGGEEFAFTQRVMKRTDDTVDLSNPAERIRNNINLQLESGPMTASFGTTTYIDGDDYSSILDRANVALNLAKLLGKNRTVNADVQSDGTVSYTDLTGNPDGSGVNAEYDLSLTKAPMLDSSNNPVIDSKTGRPKITSVISVVRQKSPNGDGRIFDVVKGDNAKSSLKERVANG